MAKSKSAKSKSNQTAEGDRTSLPFEPKGTKRKAAKGEEQKAGTSAQKKKVAKADADASPQISAKAQAQVDQIRANNRKKAQAKKQAEGNRDRTDRSTSGRIPEAVSKRMLRRMAFFSGMPVLLGVGVFFLAYYIRSQGIADFPPVAVLLVTMGCFGLGVVGLTYGVLSASWDEAPGGLVGLAEFKLNFGRIMDARRAAKASKT